jgi:hypothetical protein
LVIRYWFNGLKNRNFASQMVFFTTIGTLEHIECTIGKGQVVKQSLAKEPQSCAKIFPSYSLTVFLASPLPCFPASMPPRLYALFFNKLKNHINLRHIIRLRPVINDFLICFSGFARRDGETDDLQAVGNNQLVVCLFKRLFPSFR